MSTREPEQFDDADELFANLPEVVREFKRSRHRQTFLLVFVTVIGLVGGWLLQGQAADIKASTDADRITLAETRQTAFQQCRLVNDNARHLNQFLDAAIASVKANDALTKDEKDYRVSLYASIKQQLPICEAP